jgi:hypothetical protein
MNEIPVVARLASDGAARIAASNNRRIRGL